MKNKIFLIVILSFYMNLLNAQDIWVCKKGSVSFFSKAPLEDIFSESSLLISAVNTSTQKVSAKIKISSMEFENILQQEHFNEKYMESDKYPYANFSGEIVDKIDFTKNNVYKTKVKGELEIHGVKQPREIDVEIKVENSVIIVSSKFKVKISEHDVEVPQLVFNKVAEIVEITLNGEYQKYEK